MVEGFILAVFGLAVARIAWLEWCDRNSDVVLNVCATLIAAFLFVMSGIALSGIARP